MNQGRRDLSGAHFESSTEAPRGHVQYHLELGHQFQYRFQSRNRHSRFRLVRSRPVRRQRGEWDGRHRDSVQSSDLHAPTYDAEPVASLQHRRERFVRDRRLAERARERAGGAGAGPRTAAARAATARRSIGERPNDMVRYTAGMTVTENGVIYKANWWTQGADPAHNNGGLGTGQPWTILAS